jgi:hypothetical protein
MAPLLADPLDGNILTTAHSHKLHVPAEVGRDEPGMSIVIYPAQVAGSEC